jgi:uncharacterized protein
VRLLTEEELEDLAVGAAILGTGGGGNPYVGKLLAQQAIARYGPVELVAIEELPDDARTVFSAMMGAPTVMVEKIPRGDELVHAFEALRERLGGPITHVVPAEVGGINSTLPVAAAARLRLPLVDADGMGRAFPEIQMCTPTIYGIAATPMALADEKGNTGVIQTVDNLWTERLSRSITIDFGCTALIALYPMTGAQARKSLIPATLTLAADLGRLVREGGGIDAVLARLRGHRLFEGKVADVERRTVGGFARGEARIEGTGADAGSVLRIRFQNEHLIALREGEVVASVPDLIIVLDAETGEPITTEELRYGFRVTVVAAPCDERWRTEEGLRLVGPRYFGYDVDYVPIERRAAAAARGSAR